MLKYPFFSADNKRYSLKGPILKTLVLVVFFSALNAVAQFTTQSSVTDIDAARVREAINSNREALENWSKKENGRYVVSDADVAATKESLCAALAIESCQITFTGGADGSALLNRDTLIYKAQGERSKATVVSLSEGKAYNFDYIETIPLHNSENEDDTLMLLVTFKSPQYEAAFIWPNRPTQFFHYDRPRGPQPSTLTQRNGTAQYEHITQEGRVTGENFSYEVPQD